MNKDVFTEKVLQSIREDAVKLSLSTEEKPYTNQGEIDKLKHVKTTLSQKEIDELKEIDVYMNRISWLKENEEHNVFLMRIIITISILIIFIIVLT